ncbi:glycosyltransferase family 4 protein [Lacinutrix himadriensis]|uniref:glycosyltransferase family 4 protein n=1 Tax=Lacinutrix himadriensis TaxID=641549 RepID=UPI0006E4251B|nr:glycosyltransferase [Lacinutrix himadriensis]
MSIKVIQLFHSFPLFYQPYLMSVVDRLDAQDDLDFNVVHFHGTSRTNAIKVPGYYKRRVYERLQNIYNKQPLKLNYMEQYCLKEQVDVLHVMDSFLFPKVLNLLELAANKRPKVIVTMRGDDTYVKPLLYDKWKLFYKEQANKIDAFIAMSTQQKKQLIKLGVEASKVNVIPISFKPSQVTPKIKPDPNEIRITSAFRFVWEKNIDGNLRVIKFLKESGYKVRYQLFGSGHRIKELMFFIEKYDISDCVVLKGKMPYQELMTGLLESDFYLQLSHSESLGMSVIEAQSLGLPAIISNAGGLPETIVPGKSGYCVDAWDAAQAAKYIIDLWKNPSNYASFSKNGMVHSHENFTVDKEVDALNALYTKLLIP